MRRFGLLVGALLVCACSSPVEESPQASEPPASAIELTHRSGLRAHPDDGGLVLLDQSDKHLGTLRWEAVMRGDDRAEIARGDFTMQGERLIGARGDHTEWYVADARGLEQGFDLTARPHPDTAGALVLAITTEGLTPRLNRRGDAIQLHDRDDQPVLRYAGLVVRDASGDEVPSRLAVEEGEIHLVINDADARYPLAVDPFIQTQELQGSTVAFHDRFGADIDRDGDWMVVASINGDEAFVFQRQAGVWAETQRLTASDLTNGSFGVAVAMHGTTLFVGAPFDDTMSNNGGAVYVFEEAGGVWTETDKLTWVGIPWNSSFFGASIAVDGGRLLVGAPGSNRAYFFDDVGGTWTQVAEVVGTATHDDFGNSVTVQGDYAIVGANDNNNGTTAGAAHVFEHTGSWSEVAVLTPTAGAIDDAFGSSVALDGTKAIIGAPEDDTQGNQVGAAYLFERTAGVWTETDKLVPSDTSLLSFGSAVDLLATTVIVGAPKSSANGAAVVFEDNAGTWSETIQLAPLNRTTWPAFGIAVELDGGDAIIGQDWFQFDQGVFVFEDLAPLAGGSPCVHETQCVSGMCTDGVCCDAADCGTCQTCALAGMEGTCQFEPAATACGDATDTGCNGADTCDGAGTCQPNFAAAGFVCGVPMSCHANDTCDGAGTCVDQGWLPSGTACGSNFDDDCTDPDTCDGGGACLQNHEAEGSSCGNQAATDCDQPDTCNAFGGCNDNLVPNGTSCGNTATTECSNADTCNTGVCQPNHRSSGTFCGDASNTDCDARDTCDGNGACNDNLVAAGMLCNLPPGTCELADTCNGAGSCIDSGLAPAGALCNFPTPSCHASDTCDAGGNCIDNGFEAAGTSCGSQQNTDCSDPDTCDGAGICDGNHAPAGVACGDMECDECNNFGACVVSTFGTACNLPTADCSVQDTCDFTGTCTDNGFMTAGTTCGDPSTTTCTAPDACDATGTCLGNHAPVGTACGDTTDTECNAADTCDADGLCADNFAPAGTACGDATDTECNAADSCNSTGSCEDNVSPGGVSCGDGVCESCDAGTCTPTPAGQPGPGCDDTSANPCNAIDACDGSGTCTDGIAENGTACDGGLCEDGTCRPSPASTPKTETDEGCGCQLPGQRTPSRIGWAWLMALPLLRRRRAASHASKRA